MHVWRSACRASHTLTWAEAYKCSLAVWPRPLPSVSDFKMRFQRLTAIVSAITTASACGGDHSCYGPLKDDVVLTRNVRRMQPEALNATTGPRAPLEWGQINFLHTTDTHGWLEGHIKEQVRYRDSVSSWLRLTITRTMVRTGVTSLVSRDT